jgi:hypothetical protein
MEALHLLLYIAHMIAMVALVVGAFVPPQSGRPIQAWAARIQLLLGLLLVTSLEMARDEGDPSLNHMKIGIKLLIMLAVVALAEIANKKHKRGEPSQNLAYGAAALTIVNAAIAFLW